jgi:hypothetical protein
MLDPRHGVDRLGHHAAVAIRHLAGAGCRGIRLLGIRRVPLHGHGDFLQRGRRLLQARGLFLGALGEVRRAGGNLGRGIGDLVGRHRERLDRLLQPRYCEIELVLDFLIGFGKVVGEAERQVALGQPAEPGVERANYASLLFRLSALLLRRHLLRLRAASALRRSLVLETLLLDRPIPEHEHRSRHLPDLVLVPDRGHVEAGVA